ncbi:MAG: LSU ribosomal protein L30p (L7e), partial [uncultured Rubrobacteraceae bacterium]
ESAKGYTDEERYRLPREAQEDGEGSGPQAHPGFSGAWRHSAGARYDPEGQAPGKGRGGGRV